MSRLRVVWRLLALAVLAGGCSGLPDSVTIDFGNQGPNVDDIVRATFQAMTAAAPSEVSAHAAEATGSISGSLNYPAESLPAMYITAFEIGTQNYKYVTTTAGQAQYQIDGLSAGNYQVVAYTVGSQSFPAGLSGGYTQAVLCGLGPSCSDHTLVSISLAQGQAITGVNPADWYLVSGAFPAFPGSADSEVVVTTPAAATTGSITGSLMYPASGIPALRIVAFQVGGGAYYYVDTAAGQSTYSLQDVPPGTYHVVAYVRPGGGFNPGAAGGYSQMVPCGLQYGCNDHSLIDVLVTPGATSTGVDPTDFYADPGAFPANPAP